VEKTMSKTNKLQELNDHEIIASVDVEQWLHMYEQMLKIRRFEEQVDELYKSGKMPGLAHLYIGQEAIAVGVCEVLEKDDFITSTHRGHGHCLAKGATVNQMYAELLGKAPGYCGGKGGSMHIADPDTGNLGANAIVGGSAGIATGAAYSCKWRGTKQVAVCFFGEGALGQGLLYEVMNMASLWKLPVIYVCEKNLYNMYTPTSTSLAGDLKSRPMAFGIQTEEVDGQDIRSVYQSASRLVAHARDGKGPSFLICNTYRFRGHHVGDLDRAYRSRGEEAEWIEQHDPLKILEEWLTEEKNVKDDILESIGEEISAEITAGVEFALNAPYPDPNEVTKHVYTSG
jgi:TPP-dependent pyruvate/acetoin dehydrogenase alpha subunit